MLNILNRRGISSVVATALLLVVCVTSVVLFQSWGEHYFSKNYVFVEQESKNSDNINIETIVGDELYLRTNNLSNKTILNIKVNNKYCNISSSFNGTENFKLPEKCFSNLTSNIADVVIIGEDFLINKKIYLKEDSIALNSGTSSETPSLPSESSVFSSIWDTTQSGTPNNQINYLYGHLELIILKLTGEMETQIQLLLGIRQRLYILMQLAVHTQ